MPYRDEHTERDLPANVAQRRAVQLRAELAAVERLAGVLAGDVSSAAVVVRRERGALAKAVDPFELWWWRNLNSQPRLLWSEPTPDPKRIAHERIDLTEAEVHTAITTELAAIARARAATLRARAAEAEACARSGTVPSQETCAAVADACLRDTLELAVEVRRTIDAADLAAGDAVSEAIRAAIQGRDTATHSRTSSFSRALRELGRARVQLELVVASLLPLRGSDDPIVAGLATIARDLCEPVDAPDEAWRRHVATRCARTHVVLADLERGL